MPVVDNQNDIHNEYYNVYFYLSNDDASCERYLKFMLNYQSFLINSLQLHMQIFILARNV